MHAHVHHCAAAAVFLALTPVAGHIGIPAGELREARNRTADLAVGNGLFHSHDVCAKAHHQTCRNLDALALTVVNDLLPLFRGHGQRLFNQNMLASVGGHHGLLGVQHNGGRDINRVNLGIGQQRSLAVIRTLAAPLGAGLFRQLHIDLHYSNQLGVIRQHHSGNRSAVCNAARADNAPTKLFHSNCLLL